MKYKVEFELDYVDGLNIAIAVVFGIVLYIYAHLGWFDFINCSEHSICFEWMKGLPAAFVALVIGLFAGYIAYQQYHVAKGKLNLDLFERRLKIFQHTWETLSGVVRNGAGPPMANFGTPFNNLLPETKFLFGPEIHDYLVDCTRNWIELGALEAEKVDIVGTDKQRNIQRTRELRNWFEEQAMEECKVRFGEYLDFSRWKSQ